MSFFTVIIITLIQIIAIMVSFKQAHLVDNIDFIVFEVEAENDHNKRMSVRRLNQKKYSKKDLLDVRRTGGKD